MRSSFKRDHYPTEGGEMKLSTKERKAIDMLRELDARQRDKLLDHMRRQVLANRITAKVAGVRRLRTVDDSKIERAFGAAPYWRAKSRKPLP